MNRDFVKEYKKYADIDTPDLWSRIEAGIDAYEEALKAADESEAGKNADKIINIASSPKFASDTESTENNDSSATAGNDVKADGYTDGNTGRTEAGHRKSDRKKSFGESRFAVFARRYGGMVAAVACGVAVLSVMGITKLASDKNYSAGTAMESAAPAAEEASEAPADYAAAEEAYDEAAVANEEAMEAPAETFYEAEEEAADEAYADEPAAASEDASYAAEAAEAEESYEAEASEVPSYSSGSAMATGSSEAPTEDVLNIRNGAEESLKTGDTTYSINSKTADIQASKATEQAEISANILSISKDTAGDTLILRLKVTDPGKSDIEKGEEIIVYTDAASKDAITVIRNKGIDKKKQYKIFLTIRNGRYILNKIE